MNVLVFSEYYLPGYKGGGPIKTIRNLFESADDRISFKLITSDRDLGDKKPYETVGIGKWNHLKKTAVYYAKPGILELLKIRYILQRKDYDLLYLNSFFSLRFSIFPLLWAKILRKKVVLAPRGEFSVGALSLKATKKNVYLKFFKFFKLHKGIVFQASSVFEKEDIRKNLGQYVDVYIAEDIGAQEFAQPLVERKDDFLKIVFVSRISPMKNLLTALKILESVKNPLVYHIYGPIEDEGYWEECEDVIARLPSHVKVEYMGPLMPEKVVSTLSKYDAFYFPTAGENYGHVIAEALCASLPLIIANTTPWRNLQQQGIGWDLTLDHPSGFSEVLDYLFSMSSEQHLKMRKNVHEWAKVKFSQRDAIEANIAMFKYTYEKA